MKRETIINRIDQNIMNLLNTVSTEECTELLQQILQKFKTKQNERKTNETSIRDKYVQIYTEHTEQRIREIRTNKINNTREFKKHLFIEKLKRKVNDTQNNSTKYRNLSITGKRKL